ncbi:PTS transporter subunit EIIC [Pediococcus ethanolidurans]|uniref:PTS transporter subunit EIIC n=1 Tax=Pediococcus ethanolidurans TaxID=319653 RepID=UPI001C1E9A6A|nr:PTS transporter subunit EIIC [Pediococcus ethanolidurans]MBU7554213.1 PTS sugar transporter subunit IIC [Pediococcus ethanolidurans]MCT4399023.1 PTS sugar transporter subunit IIC [Pediococcus ethanolidurans]MCV3324187.1 PTS transporter subunit EIIC [Pediococcus ethanolidurans]
MTSQLIKITKKLYKQNFYQAILSALWLIFPLEFVAATFHIIYETGFHRNGILEVILNLHTNLPGFYAISYLLKSTNDLTFITISLLLAFFTAENLFELRSKLSHEHLAGITSLFIYFLLIVETAPSLDFPQITEVAGNLLIPIVIGLLTGYGYSLLARNSHIKLTVSYWATNRLIIIFSLLIVVIGAISFAVYQTQLFPNYLSQQLQNLIQVGNRPSFWKIILATFLSNIGHFFGVINDSTTTIGNHFSSGTANLTYLADHHNLWKIPYPITLHSLYDSYGALGGNGMLLALAGTILIRVKNQRARLVAGLSFTQTLFDQGEALMIGIPILFNPLFLIPFLVTPIVSMSIGYLAIVAHLVPASAYVIPYATPSILRAFLGTNGNFGALLISLLSLVISGLIYYPFVSLIDQLVEGKEADFHA